VAARLKVFVTSDGLTDFVVAASSRAKALAAWGSHQDLFKTGLAHETDDPQLTAAATAKPGEVLRRPAGTRGDLAHLKPPKPPSRGPSKAALKKVADLEARIAAADAAYADASQEIARKREALDRAAADLTARHEAEAARLRQALATAKRALG